MTLLHDVLAHMRAGRWRQKILVASGPVSLSFTQSRIHLRCHADSWNVRERTSSCCSLVSLTKFTA